jgi:hypothetical protein
MMVRFFKITFLLLCTLPPALQVTAVEAEEVTTAPRDYTAVYQVFRNDKVLAGVTISLSHQDDIWTLHGFTHDMQGLAELLKVKGSQTATGTWQNGRFIPENYRFSFSVIGYKTDWYADFDWSSGIVTTRGKKGDALLPLTGGAVDPFSLSLNIRSHLAEDQPRMAVKVVDEDEIDDHVYQAELNESIDTPLGCLETTRVKRLRKNLKRISLVWYANDHGYIPVMMQHSKKNGNDFRLQIISLDLDGQIIQPVGSCGDNDDGSQPLTLSVGMNAHATVVRIPS